MGVGWLAGAYALGIACADSGWLGPDAAAVLLVQGGWLGLLCAGLPRARWPLALLVAAAAGAHATALLHAEPYPGAPLEAIVEGRVEEAIAGPGGQRVTLHDVRATEPVTLPRRIRLAADPLSTGEAGFEPGERVRARVRLRAPTHRFNPGSPDPAERLARKGVGAVGRMVDPQLRVRLGPAERGLRAGMRRRRERAAAQLAAAGRGGALVAALGLGHRTALGRGDADAMRRLGLAHLLAVSGLHLGLAAGLAYAVALALLRRSPRARRRDVRRDAMRCALLLATLYAWACGFGVPLQRAYVFLLAIAASATLGRSLRPAGPLALAALFVLLRDPTALFAPGAQLSFAASAGLLAARRPAPREGIGAGVHRLLDTSAAALAATTPLVALHFGTSTPVGLLANVAAVPWVASVLLPACMAASAAALIDPGGAWAGVFGAPAKGLATATLAAVHAAADLIPPGALGGGASRFGVLAAALLGGIALRAPSLVIRVALVLAQSAALALLPGGVSRRADPVIWFLDVGQGDATLVRSPHGAVLIDAGPAIPGGWDAGHAVVVPALRRLGVGRLDLVVASHGDLDHRGGLPAILDALPVERVWIPFGSALDPAFAALQRTARRHGVPVEERGSGAAPLSIGELQVVPLWPPRVDEGRDDNDRSLVVRVDVAGRRVLLPGDLEREGEQALLARAARALAADVLKLPHHGSASSSSAAFVAAVGPTLAIASAPCRGRFAMPADEVRQRLAAARTTLWWTGRHGAVSVGARGRLRAGGFGPAGGLPACRLPRSEGAASAAAPAPESRR